MGTWHSFDFAHVYFVPTLGFIYFIDPSDLMNDTETSRGLVCWMDEHDSQAFRSIYGYWPLKPSNTEFDGFGALTASLYT